MMSGYSQLNASLSACGLPELFRSRSTSCCRCWIKQYCTMCKLEQVNKLLVGSSSSMYFSNCLPGSLMHTKRAALLRQSISVMSTLCKTSMSWVHCCTTCCVHCQITAKQFLMLTVPCPLLGLTWGAFLLYMAWEFPKTATSQITWTIVKWSLSLFEC